MRRSLQALPNGTAQYIARLDLDDNAATGCMVTTADGPCKGGEQMLVTTVDLTQTPPRVISFTQQACTGGNTFGAPAAVMAPSAPPWPVGIGNGTSGSAVVETYLPISTGYGGTANNVSQLETFLNGTATMVVPTSAVAIAGGGTIKAALLPTPCPTPP